MHAGLQQSGEKPRVAIAKMSMKRDPGYGATCRMITEAAMCLVKQRADVANFSVLVGGQQVNAYIAADDGVVRSP